MSKKTKKDSNTLPMDLEGKRKQMAVDGSKTVKESTPKEIQTAADAFFSKKEDFACAKSNLDKAAEELLCVMGKLKMTQAIVFDAEGYKKCIVIRVGAEKLKVEKSLE